MIGAVFTYYATINGYLQTPDDQELTIPDLEPLYEPQAVAFSYDTPAWYLLFALLLIALLFGLWKWYKSYQSKAYRRTALKKLEDIKLTDTQDNTALSTIQITLKQVAIATYGRPEVAALFGMEWLQFLERTGKHTPFTQFEILIGSNAEASNTHIGSLRDTAKKWIRTHA